jgi:hypothetical protein
MLMRTPQRWVRPKRQLPPGFIVACQPTLANKVPEGDGWIHELKHDSLSRTATRFVCVAQRTGLVGRVRRDQRGHAGATFKRVMLDGGAVAHCLDGLPDFHRLLGDGQATAGGLEGCVEAGREPLKVRAVPGVGEGAYQEYERRSSVRGHADSDHQADRGTKR